MSKVIVVKASMLNDISVRGLIFFLALHYLNIP
jgi:hypothetical protein